MICKIPETRRAKQQKLSQAAQLDATKGSNYLYYYFNALSKNALSDSFWSRVYDKKKEANLLVYFNGKEELVEDQEKRKLKYK